MKDEPEFTFEWHQLFNIFGAPGIPNTYEATLYRNNRIYKVVTFHFRGKAERQCEKWVRLYGARPR